MHSPAEDVDVFSQGKRSFLFPKAKTDVFQGRFSILDKSNIASQHFIETSCCTFIRDSEDKLGFANLSQRNEIPEEINGEVLAKSVGKEYITLQL